MKQDICFSSFRDLEEQINNKYSKSNEKKVVSQATLNRMVKKEDYEPFFTYHRCYYGKQGIVLNNDFRGDRGKTEPFVVLTAKTQRFLIEQKDNLLAKYVIFIKYQCGRGNSNTDFTADQFLQAIGYSVKAGSTKTILSNYNRLLVEKGFLKITPIRIDGKQRNIYTFID